MRVIKRWAFWPPLALVGMVATSAAVNADHGSTAGTLAGLTLSAPLAILIGRRRQHRWGEGRARRLFR